MTSSPSLSGIHVVELGEGWTSALAGRLCADLGAQVTKLEVPWDPLRRFGRNEAEQLAAYRLPNAGKRLLSADLDDPNVRRELEQADVLLLDTATATRLGFAIEDAAPRTVVCRFASFDVTGPLAAWVASDLVLQAMSGVLDTTGEASGPPLRAGTELSTAVGALYGVFGTLAALVERERSGLGQVVDVSLYDCLVSTLTNFASRVLGGVEPLGRIGNQGPNSAPWELFETADGDYVFIIAGSPPTFERLTAVMGRPELVTDPRFSDPLSRRANTDAITAIVSDWTRARSRDEVVSLLRANGVPVSPVTSIEELLVDPHLRSRGMLGRTPLPDGGSALTVGSPLGVRDDSLRATAAESRLATKDDGDDESEPTASKSPRTAPLDGVRVVDFGNLTAGPFCTRLYANLGAAVLKIEPPAGELGRHMPPIVNGESVFFQISNNDKRSMRASLRDPDDLEMVAQVIAQADILVENQAPGALEKRGLGPERLLAMSPSLIYTSATGYGHEGELGGLRAYDTVIQAGAGLMSLTGEESGHPLKTGISSADVLGALASGVSSLAAYFGRLTGRHGGARLDVALFDICAWSTQMAWVTGESDLGVATRHGNGHWLFAPHDVLRTADGELVAIACESDEQWQSLAGLLEAAVPDLCPPDSVHWDRATRWARRAELTDLLSRFATARNVDVVVEALQQVRVPSGRVATVQEVFTVQQRLASTTTQVTRADGRSWVVTDVPIRLSATPGAVTSPGPDLGGADHHVRQDLERAWASIFDQEQEPTTCT